MNGRRIGKMSGGDEVCCSESEVVGMSPERKDCGIVGGDGECHVAGAESNTTCQHGDLNFTVRMKSILFVSLMIIDFDTRWFGCYCCDVITDKYFSNFSGKCFVKLRRQILCKT
jgi:hypothetical protein